MYGVSGTHKLAKSRSGKWSLEVTVPSRRITLNADAGKVKGNYEASVEAAWDADKDKNAKVSVLCPPPPPPPPPTFSASQK